MLTGPVGKVNQKSDVARRFLSSLAMSRGMPVTSNMFATLEPVGGVVYRRSMSFICGIIAQVLIIVFAVLVGLMFPRELRFSDKHVELIWLPSLTPPPPKPVAKLPRELPHVAIPKVVPPPQPKLVVSVPKIEVPQIHHVVPPPMPVHELPLPTAAAPAPAPKVKEQIVVRTGLFGGAPEPVTTKKPVEMVQTGGFGKPDGLPSRTPKENSGNAPVLGAFGLPSGPGSGNGTAGNHGVQGVVKSVGFGSGVASVANGRGRRVGSLRIFIHSRLPAAGIAAGLSRGIWRSRRVDTSSGLRATREFRFVTAGAVAPSFELTSIAGTWQANTLYQFQNAVDGWGPGYGAPTFDSAGNMYGTTEAGGKYGFGTVFKLSHGKGGWTKTTLYDFPGGAGGSEPLGGVVVDKHGNLYGATYYGGKTGGRTCKKQGCGIVFEITP